jgi:hypothetical protein
MLLMLLVKEAVQQAIKIFSELFPNAKDVRLEEVELSTDGPWWEITLSFVPMGLSAFESVLGQANRVYKRVEIDRETGELNSIKIRKI